MTWKVQAFHSGTIIVTNNTEPHLHIIGPSDGDEAQQSRWGIAEDIAKKLNGGWRPAWFDDMILSPDGFEAHAADGTQIIATGPYYDTKPPACCWDQERSAEADEARRALIQLLLSGREEPRP